jgi:hypothetical protein
MKFMRFCATSVLSSLTAAGVCLAADTPPPSSAPPVPAATAAPGSPVSGAIIQFDNTMFDFVKVSAGEKVRHNYVVTNTGTETLQITNVHPGCHCTTAGDWTHKIDPGKTGVIPVQFDSSGFSGNISRTIDVYSNAKNEPHKVLMLKGLIWKPLEYASTALINIPADTTNDMTTSVKIVNQTENPVTFSNVVSANHLFDGVLKEIKPGKEYELVVTAHPPFPNGNTPSVITINTSLPGTPTINVTAMARVNPAVQVSPSQVILNPLPDRPTTNRVNIVSTTAKEFVLSNPKASDSQIQVDIQPGFRPGMFVLMIVTPPGFHLPQGQRAEVSVESNHPRYPVIKVPIMQYNSPRPYAAVHPATPPAPAHP